MSTTDHSRQSHQERVIYSRERGDSSFVSVRDHERVVATLTYDNALLRRGLGSTEPRPVLQLSPWAAPLLKACAYELVNVTEATRAKYVSFCFHEMTVKPLRDEHDELQSAIIRLNYAAA